MMAAALAGAMLLGGCGDGKDQAAEGNQVQGESQDNSQETKTADDAQKDGYSFAGDIVGQGVQALDNLVAEEEYIFYTLGSEFQIYNDNFTADTQGTNVQTMASAGYDGMMVFGWNATLYTTISNTAKEAKVPFVMFDQIPTEEEMIRQLEENEYYVGSVGVDNYELGANIAKRMRADGIAKALILGGSVGDVVHDARVAGFTDAFTKDGGEVTGTARCSDPAEATTKEDDMISGNADAEATYCLTGDYAIAAIAALENHSNTKMALYCSDTTSETIPYIKDGTITCGDGGSKIATVLAACLLYNYADGNIVKDENGKAPNFDTIVSFEVNAENADQYEASFLSGHPVNEEGILGLVGEGVTYQTFADYISNFSLETVLGE